MTTTDIAQLRKTNLRRVMYFASCYTALFTAFCAAQNLISQIYADLGFGKLGAICLFLIFTGFSLVSIIASFYQKRIPFKYVLMGTPLFYIFFIAAGTLTTFCAKYEITGGLCAKFPIFVLNVIGAAGVGCASAFLWLAQSMYVDACSDDDTKGILNGTFWSIFQMAQIFSGILATLILGNTDSFTFYSFLCVFACLAVVMFSFVPAPPAKEAPTTENSSESLVDSLKKFYKLFYEKECYFLFMVLFFSGVAIGSYINFLGAYVAATVEGGNQSVVNQSIGYVLIVLAIGEVGAGLSMGKFADMFDKGKLLTITMLINEAALLVSFLAVVFQSFSLAILCGLLWGYGDTGIQTMLGVTIGSKFGGRVELFSAYRFLQNAGVVFASILGILIPRDMQILYIMIIAATLVALHSLYQKYLPNDEKKAHYQLYQEDKLAIELKNL